MNYNYQQLQYQPQQAMAYRPMQQWAPPVTANQQVRPVSSIEEVKACPIDFDGSIFFFPDLANRKIYTKQINLDGTVSINLYELKTDQSSAELAQQYITKQEFENVINQLQAKYDALLNPPEKQQPNYGF